MGMSSGKVLRWRQRHDASVIQIDDDDARSSSKRA